MPDLTASTALGDHAPRTVTHGGLVIEENTSLALASLALQGESVLPVPFGLHLPAPGGWTSSECIAALWTGPGQWMIEGQGQAETDFAGEIAAQCPGCAVTEQTDGFVSFEVRSKAGTSLIQALSEKLLNLNPAHLKPGMGCRTGFHHMSVFAIRRAECQIAIMSIRSAAASIWHELETAAARLAVHSS